MISNQILQDTIEGIKSVTRIDLCVMDTEGKTLATTLRDVDEYEQSVIDFADSPAESQVLQGYQFFKVFDDNQLEYIILARDCNKKNSDKIIKLCKDNKIKYIITASKRELGEVFSKEEINVIGIMDKKSARGLLS